MRLWHRFNSPARTLRAGEWNQCHSLQITTPSGILSILLPVDFVGDGVAPEPAEHYSY